MTSTGNYSPPPLQQQSYAQYSSPSNPYPLSSLSTGQTPAEPPIYAQSAPTNRHSQAEEQPANGGSTESDIKARLRKACDSCSIRKVKCDEQGPPCRACSALDIPCTFERPSRRRGPPNRHAEAIKRRRIDSPGGSIQSTPASPTHAAHALASFAQQQVLSAESICPFSLLLPLIDDYFTYIHPLIPVPHEPSFREALHRREDVSNPTFLAVLASMIGALVASFPRKPRQHLKAQHKENLFPNSMSLVERCHKITIEARGPGYLDRELTVYDAVISYLQGLTGVYVFNWRQCKLYFGECLVILRILGLHRSSDYRKNPMTLPAQHASAIPGGADIRGDYIAQEMGKRTFWVMFVGVKTIHQLGVGFGELFIPPPTPGEPYPPLPIEVDDAFIYPNQILPQPSGLISEIVGFNANVRIFCSYNSLTAVEMVYGVNEVFDWDRQQRVIENCLQTTKSALDGVPQELLLRPGSSSSGFNSGLRDHERELLSPVLDYVGTHEPGPYPKLEKEDSPSGRRRIQCEIQKANIYASHLSTRSHIVEKYWNLSDTYAQTLAGNGLSTDSPGKTAANLDYHLQQAGQYDATMQEMAAEQEAIIKELLQVLSMISQVNMEPNGGSFINKTRQIASTLLDVPRTRKGQVALRAEEYLAAFLNVLMKLERTGPSHAESGEFMLGSEEDEEAELRHWADLREYQNRFAQSGGFLSES